VEGFRAIGQPQIADLVVEAMAALGVPYHRDRSARQIALDKSPEEKLADLDQSFFSLIGTEAGGFDAAADAYVKGLVGSRRRT
jgi:hypothetical protein